MTKDTQNEPTVRFFIYNFKETGNTFRLEEQEIKKPLINEKPIVLVKYEKGLDFLIDSDLFFEDENLKNKIKNKIKQIIIEYKNFHIFYHDRYQETKGEEIKNYIIDMLEEIKSSRPAVEWEVERISGGQGEDVFQNNPSYIAMQNAVGFYQKKSND